MGKLDVDPPRLAGAGKSLDSKTDALASAVQALQTALSSSGQMCGNDAAGKAFGLSYRQGGQALLTAVASAVNACRKVGYGIEVSASNYAQSEAASRIGGGEPSVLPPSEPSAFSCPTMPNPFGPAVGEPLLWSIVRELVGSPWPDGNPATLRAAAGAWRSFGGAIAGVSGAVGGCSAEVIDHAIPELASIIHAVTQLSFCVGDLEKQCETIETSLNSFAGEVEASQQAIRDLLHRLSLSGILEELGSIFSGHNPWDDVKKVADDIKQILHTLGREADASSSLFQTAMSELDTLTTQFENWTRKEFTHFLGNKVGNGFADLYNSDVDILEGGVKSVFETVGGLGDLATHPQKLLDLAKQANPGYQIANFVADPKAAFEHNLDVVKGLVDAKDWNSDHPLRGFGDNLGTGLQFLIPGAGEAKAGAEGARAADEAATAAKADGKAADGLLAGGLKSDVAGQSSRIAHDLDGIKATPAEPGAAKPVDPGAAKPADPAPAGRPTDLGAAKPAETGSTVRPAEPGAAKPAEPATTARATEPGSGGGAGAHEPAGGSHEPALVGAPHEPAPAGSAAAPAEHAPAAAPHGAGGSPMEHAGGSPHSVPESHPGGGDAHGRAPHDPGGHGGGGDGSDRGGGGHGDGEVAGGDGHGSGGDHHPEGGITEERRDEILAMEKGSRPDPSDYLSPQYIEQHLDKFDQGATRFMLNDTFDDFGIGQRDGTTFVFPTSEIDALMNSTKGDPSALEKALGLPEGYFNDNVIRVDIPDPRQYDIRIPSGNEAGANDLWLPGGLLPQGMPEAVIDGVLVPPEDLVIDDSPLPEGSK